MKGFLGAGFVLLDCVSDRFLIGFKTIFFLAITSLKRVLDLQAMSVSLDFTPGIVKALLYPKVFTNVARPIILLFHPF